MHPIQKAALVNNSTELLASAIKSFWQWNLWAMSQRDCCRQYWICWDLGAEGIVFLLQLGKLTLKVADQLPGVSILVIRGEHVGEQSAQRVSTPGRPAMA